MSISARIAHDLQVPVHQVDTTIGLLDGGATVPFIARYRKEVTGGLDDVQLRQLAAGLVRLRALEAERTRILAAIREQGKLTPELERRIRAADSRARLDDLYLPYKTKRRTKAMIAREAGLEPLALSLLNDPRREPRREAARFVRGAIADVDAALEGARDILIERWAEDADLATALRDHVRERGSFSATVIDGQQQQGATYRDYFDYSEACGRVPAHRALAVLRGKKEEILRVHLTVETPRTAPSSAERLIAHHARLGDRGRPADGWLLDSVMQAWRKRLKARTETQLLSGLRKWAEQSAIDVFAKNLADLLLAPPAGRKTTLGLDPGIRTGVKVAVVEATGRVLDTATIYPFQPKRDVEGSLVMLERLVRRHGVTLIAIGNGTGSRETDRLVADLFKRLDAPPTKVVVSEAGASVYSASELASAELPDMDVSLRGAVSIARRLQDPLAELVKIDPKSIGVGQYQHDVAAGDLATALDGVVEDCVNAVGVDLNTASPSLLSRIAGLNDTLAHNIVATRDSQGAFKRRRQLLDVPRLGARTFEQCAGFLRITEGDEPLDGTGVHPEAYDLARKICRTAGRSPSDLLGDAAALRSLDPNRFTDDRFGLPTVRDILAELEKPGRDPRPAFRQATLADGVEAIGDLVPGMVLEGTVTNVAAFGAFVDVGVHQDGLVHVSRIADRFVRDPHEVVRAGQIVTVRVVEVDLDRKRIALSMRKED